MEQPLIGLALSRVDGPLKVTGRATYAAEHPIPNVAHAVLITSSICKGRVVAMDIQDAQSLPGVLTILTPFNAPRLPPVKEGGKKDPTARKLNTLQESTVYYSNQPIGLAVAETLEQAQHAAEAVRVRYAMERPTVVLENALDRRFAPSVAGPRGDPTDTNRGDLQAGLIAGAGKVENTYVTPMVVHNPMEPHATIAVWDGPRLTLYDATQGVFSDRKRTAELLGMEPDNVRVVSPYLGGGFGSKGPVWSHVILAAMAAKQVRRPVKLVVKREQMFGMLGFRARTRQTLKAAGAQDGKMTALSFDTVAQTSSFDDFVETAGLSSRMLYASDANATTHRLVRLDMGTPSFMRAPGEAPGTFGLESTMDELAYRLNIDPIELRLKNYAEEDADKKKPFSSKSLRECYQQGAERFGWAQRKMSPRSMSRGNSLIGWGMATAVYPTNRSKSSALATLRADGSVLVESGTQDLGTGTYTVMTQIAAAELNMQPRQVTFRLGDTRFPETPVSGGSQTAASTGSAVLAAAQALREKLVQMALSDERSPLYAASFSDVSFEDGTLSLRSVPSKRETIADLMKRSGQQEIAAKGEAQPGAEKEAYSMYAFGAQFAEVHVDKDLGMVRVTRMVGAFGAGRILNEKTARSQLMGGMVWGISMALHEDAIVDANRGRLVNMNLGEYHVPANLDVPPIEVIMVPEQDQHVNPAGVKGIGEIGITGASAAIANAVYHATGKRVRELPITPDKLL